MNEKITKLIQSAQRNESNTVKITPSMAEYILDNAKFANQRKVSVSKVSEWQNLIAKGKFNKYHHIYFASYDGEYMLLNGQHRIVGCIAANKSIEIGILYQRCDTMDEIHEIYRTIDVGKTRNYTDVLRSLGIEIDVPENVWRSICFAAKILGYGFNYRKSMTGFNFNKLDQYEIEKVLRQYLSEADSYVNYVQNESLSGKIKAKSLTGQFISLGIATFCVNGGETFWEGICKDDGLREGDPRKTFLEYMKTIPSARGGYEHKMLIHNRFARCWNAWYDGKQLNKMQSVTGDMLIPLKGTDFDSEENYG